MCDPSGGPPQRNQPNGEHRLFARPRQDYRLGLWAPWMAGESENELLIGPTRGGTSMHECIPTPLTSSSQ